MMKKQQINYLSNWEINYFVVFKP